jgi:hypothetical protein
MSDVLTSWNDGENKKAILDFVQVVTDESSPSYVAPPDRVATFDNDGNLWNEKPTYIQLFFALQRLRDMAKADPSLLDKPAYKAAAEGDMAYFASLYPDDIPALVEVIYDSHAGMSQAEFQDMAYKFLTTFKHPRFDIPFKQCYYPPMVELMHYVRDNDFKVYIVSGGGMSFIRTVSEEIYDIPRENVIGSNIIFESVRDGGDFYLQRKPGVVEPIDDGPGKPVNIELHIGRAPILASGNSNGDHEMFEYTEAQAKGGLFLNLLLRHDDGEREYEYDAGAEKAQKTAGERDWNVISMKNDFKKVFPF